MQISWAPLRLPSYWVLAAPSRMWKFRPKNLLLRQRKSRRRWTLLLMPPLPKPLLMPPLPMPLRPARLPMPLLSPRKKPQLLRSKLRLQLV